MPNMSYCRFENTATDLQDCLNVMQGEDEYYLNVKKLNGSEKEAMEDIIRMAHTIVEIDEERDISPFFDTEWEEQDKEQENDDDDW